MVLFFTSNALAPEIPSVLIYMGKDKVENEELIKYAFPQDVWFHVDKLSSAHIYLRLPETIDFSNIPVPLLTDAAQLVKANSILGNKKDNITIIYTPAANLKKQGDMAIGAVSFHSDKKVKRIHVVERSNGIINRLNKTKQLLVVDHEQAKIDREKDEAKKRRAEGVIRANEDLRLERERKVLKAGRGYAGLHGEERKRGTLEEEEDEEWERKQRVGDFDPDDDFM